MLKTPTFIPFSEAISQKHPMSGVVLPNFKCLSLPMYVKPNIPIFAGFFLLQSTAKQARFQAEQSILELHGRQLRRPIECSEACLSTSRSETGKPNLYL